MDSLPPLLDEATRLYAHYLNKNKMIFTRERKRILEYILRQERHFSADDLMFVLQKENQKVSRATLYRSLNQLVSARILSEAPDFGHGHAHYEILLGQEPHVHLICQSSGEIREVHSKELVSMLERIAQKEKFHPTSYKIQIFGEGG